VACNLLIGSVWSKNITLCRVWLIIVFGSATVTGRFDDIFSFSKSSNLSSKTNVWALSKQAQQTDRRWKEVLMGKSERSELVDKFQGLLTTGHVGMQVDCLGVQPTDDKSFSILQTHLRCLEAVLFCSFPSPLRTYDRCS